MQELLKVAVELCKKVAPRQQPVGLLGDRYAIVASFAQERFNYLCQYFVHERLRYDKLPLLKDL